MKQPKILALLMLIAFLLSALSSCSGPEPQSPAQESPAALTVTSVLETTYFPDVTWQASTPEEQGMDSATLAAMLEHVQAQKVRQQPLAGRVR